MPRQTGPEAWEPSLLPVSTSPSRGRWPHKVKASMATARGEPRSEIEGFGPRRFAGGRSTWRWPAAGISWRERGTGKIRFVGPHRLRWMAVSVAKPVPGEVAAPRCSRPPPPQRAVTSPSWSHPCSSTCMIAQTAPGCSWRCPAVWADIHRIALERSERSLRHLIPAIAFSRHCSSRLAVSTPNCRDKSSTGSPRKKPQGNRTHTLRDHRPPGLGQVPAGLHETWRNLALGSGHVGQAKLLRLRLPRHGPINSNFAVKIAGRFDRHLLGQHFDCQFRVQGNRADSEVVDHPRPVQLTTANTIGMIFVLSGLVYGPALALAYWVSQ